MRFRVEYVEYGEDDEMEKIVIKTESFDKKPAEKLIKQQAKKLKAESVYLYDSELPELVIYYALSADCVMYCPKDKPGSSIVNYGTDYFHLLNKLPKYYAKHVVRSVEIDLGHKLRDQLKSPLHNDGLPKKRVCIACRKAFEAQHNYSCPPYGAVCCSYDCYIDAAARIKTDWVAEALSLNSLKTKAKVRAKMKSYLLRDAFNRVWTGCSWTPVQEDAKIFYYERDIARERYTKIPAGAEFTIEEAATPAPAKKPTPAKSAPKPEIATKPKNELVTILEKSCPNCNVIGSIDELFGWRFMNGKRKPQSRCKKCR